MFRGVPAALAAALTQPVLHCLGHVTQQEQAHQLRKHPTSNQMLLLKSYAEVFVRLCLTGRSGCS